MKKTLLSLIFLLPFCSLLAQTYKEKAGEVEKSVWGNPAPEFMVKDVPAQYSHESAVIIAQSYNTQRSANSRFKYMILTAAIAHRAVKISTFHERVKINDKTALEQYSTLEYQKKLDNSISFLIAKFNDVHETYIGAKILKPDGKEVIVNTGEEVLVKNTSKNEKGKLAIPGLEVGDILDYYISTNDLSEKNEETVASNDQVFMLVDEYPILSYSLYFQLNKNTSIYYIAANGAARLEEGSLANGDRTYSLKLKDLPKYESQLWTSRYRQYPYLKISNSFGKTNNTDILGNKTGAGFQHAKSIFENTFNDVYLPVDEDPEKRLKEYFNGKKGYKSAPLDSSMKVLYNIWKYLVFGSYNKEYLEDMGRVNYRTARSKGAVNNMSRLLVKMEIPHQILLVSSRESNSLDNVFNYNDFDAMIRIDNGANPLYMAFDDGVTLFNEIPVQFQGEKAIALRPTRKNSKLYLFDESDEAIPVIPADKNLQEEHLRVSLMPDNAQKVKIERLVKQTGYMRHDDQKALLTPMEIDNIYIENAKGDPLSKRLSKESDTRKVTGALLAGMDKTQAEKKKDFAAEIKGKFEQEPQQITDYKVVKTGLDNANPVFEYSSTFVLDNMVKKAGENYIVETGKLTGGFLKLEEKSKTRSIDVYMPAARSFRYVLSIVIPAGYMANGVEELNYNKANKTGSFSSTAAVAGNTLTITVTRSYTHNFEKAAEWPQLVDIIDAAAGFNAKKILLEKKS